MKVQTLSERQNGDCRYCGNPMIRHEHLDGVPTPPDAMTKDHVICRSRGGPDHNKNLVAACFQCNNLRSSVDCMIFTLVLYLYFWFDRTRRNRWHEHEKYELRRIREILWRFDPRRRDACLPKPVLILVTTITRGISATLIRA